MPYLRCSVMAFIVWAACPLPLLAATSASKMCKKIHDAIRAGHSVDQIIVELDTDAETVVKCTQKRGKRKPAAKQKKAPKSGSKSSSTTGTSAGEKSSSPATTHQHGAPRSKPVPAYLP